MNRKDNRGREDKIYFHFLLFIENEKFGFYGLLISLSIDKNTTIFVSLSGNIMVCDVFEQ
jgi:hypothetical protein